MARDPQGRFVRAEGEGEPEAEPEAEPEVAGLGAGQAALLAAIAGRIEALERRLVGQLSVVWQNAIGPRTKCIAESPMGVVGRISVVVAESPQ